MMESALLKALAKLLKPLIRLLLRNGVAHADFVEIAKKAYVDVAAEDFAVPGRKQSVSRIAVLTGIHRREVSRVLALSADESADLVRQHNRAARVISGWQDDPDFKDAKGGPAKLAFATEFSELVRRYSGDIPVRAVLDELVRVGAVSQSEEGEVSLLVEAYVPSKSRDDLFYLLGDCVSDLLNTVDHNLANPAEKSRLQINVAYNNVPDEALEDIQLISRERSMAFLHEMNRFLATQDRDRESELTGTGRNRVGVGLYYFEEKQGACDEREDKS